MKRRLGFLLALSLVLNVLLGWLVVRGWRERDHVISELRRREATMGDLVRTNTIIWPVRGVDAVEQKLKERLPRRTISKIQLGTPDDFKISVNDVELFYYRDSLVATGTVGQPWEYLRY